MISKKVIIERYIDEALNCDHIVSRQIEDFTHEELIDLAEYAKDNGLLLAIRAEHSNFHQGVLIELVKKDKADQFIKYL